MSVSSDERFSAQIILDALENHIQQALADQSLPPLAREKFGERLKEVRAKLAEMKRLDTAAGS